MSNERTDSVGGVLAEARVRAADPLALLFEGAGAVAGVGTASQLLGPGPVATAAGLVLGAAAGWLFTYLMSLLIVWFGTIRRLRQALDRCLEERHSIWDEEFEEFRRLSREAWQQLDAGFVTKGFFGLSAAVDSLRPLVSDAPWPEDEADGQSDSELIAEGALRDFAKRLYLKGGTQVFATAGELFAFDAQRQELAFLVKRWARQIETGDETAQRLAGALAAGIGATGLQTIKLMRYVEEAKAASISHEAPDYAPWRRLRQALDSAAPGSPRSAT